MRNLANISTNNYDYNGGYTFLNYMAISNFMHNQPSQNYQKESYIYP